MERIVEQLEISIHTSAREVTGVRRLHRYKSIISIHTSAREVTDVDGDYIIDRIHFNPHFRKGSDDPIGYSPRSDRISIHTSAREVTCPRSCSWCSGNISIHTSAREVTLNSVISSEAVNISIHTSAREVTFRYDGACKRG